METRTELIEFYHYQKWARRHNKYGAGKFLPKTKNRLTVIRLRKNS